MSTNPIFYSHATHQFSIDIIGLNFTQQTKQRNYTGTSKGVNITIQKKKKIFGLHECWNIGAKMLT